MFARLPAYLIHDVANYCYDGAETKIRIAGRWPMMAWWFGWLKFRGVGSAPGFMAQGRALLAGAVDVYLSPGHFRQLHEVFGFTKKDLTYRDQIGVLDTALWSENDTSGHPCYANLDTLKNHYDLPLFPHVEALMREHVQLWYPTLETPHPSDWKDTAHFTKRLGRGLRRETRNYWMAHTASI